MRANRLQESSESTGNGHEADTSLGSSASELGVSRLGNGSSGLSISGGVDRDGSVLGGGRVGDDSWDAVDGDSGAGLSSRVDGLVSGRSGLDGVGGGVLAVLVDNGGALGDGVGLGAVGNGGWLRADSGETVHNLGGGVGRDRGVLWGVTSGRGNVSGGRWLVTLSGRWLVALSGGRLVAVVSRGGGGLVSGAGGVVALVSVGVGVGSGGEASDNSERAHLEIWFGWVGIKYGWY